MADGGEGTLDALGGGNRTSVVTGPLGRAVSAQWRLDGPLAVIEMARASGLAVAGGRDGNDPMTATSRGTGELIAQAIEAGASRIIVALGGSANTDGGLGAVEVLERFAPFGPGRPVQIQVAADVRTVFGQAAVVFGPQKGANATQVQQLTVRLAELALKYRDRFGVDVADLAGGGAAGGLAGGLAALGAEIVNGFDLIARQLGLAAAVADADLVITGEGRVDASSLQGKVVGGVLALAKAQRLPTLVIAGQIDSDVQLDGPAISLAGRFGSARAFADTLGCVREAVAERRYCPVTRDGTGARFGEWPTTTSSRTRRSMTARSRGSCSTGCAPAMRRTAVCWSS